MIAVNAILPPVTAPLTGNFQDSIALAELAANSTWVSNTFNLVGMSRLTFAIDGGTTGPGADLQIRLLTLTSLAVSITIFRDWWPLNQPTFYASFPVTAVSGQLQIVNPSQVANVAVNLGVSLFASSSS